MPQNIKISGSQETVFFSHHEESLCQWIQVSLESGFPTRQAGQATIFAGGQTVTTTLEIQPGLHEYRLYAPALWPDHAPQNDASLSVTSAGEVVRGLVSAGHHRPWVVYLLADVCTDDTWVYDDYDAMRKDDADLTKAEVELAEASRGGPEADHNHYNLVHSIELEYFEEYYQEMVERLADSIRRGEITLNPFYNMTLTQNLSIEEQIRHFYTARAWMLKHGLEMGYANHQETPSIAWDMPGILAGIGVRHLIKAILPYECPWAWRLPEPPVFLWEGVDGTQILLRRRNWDYVEGNFVLKGLEETNKAMHERILPEYEQLGERYPFSAISLLGCYGDLIPFKPGKPQSKDLAPLKAATIAAYNAQGWEYPRLVNAAHQQYWDDLESQIARRNIRLEVYRGDYGTGWDAWPSCLALYAAYWRRAQERAGLADKLSAILSVLDPAWYTANKAELQSGWKNLRLLGDHAWNGANDANRALNASLRQGWQAEANRCFDQVIASGLQALAEKVPMGSGQRLIVFNSLPWNRDGIARVEGLEPGCAVVDAATGEAVPSQTFKEDGKAVTYFKARGVPSVGYRSYDCRPVSGQVSSDPWQIGPNRLDGPFYTVEVSPVTGGITRLFDKVRGKELVDASSPYHLNQALYLSGNPPPPGPFNMRKPPQIRDEVEYTPSRAVIEAGDCGPVSASLIVRSEMKNHQITTSITLYSGLDRVDIRNEIRKTPTSERQELDFAFPFNIPGREYRFETPAAIVNPESDPIPGAGLATAVVRQFVDIFNDDYGVTLAQADSFVVEFGHRTTTEDVVEIDRSNSTVLVMAMGNIIDGNEAIRDQHGVEEFTFRFSLQGHAGGFDPAAAVRFGWEDNNPLECVPARGNADSPLPATSISFASVEPASAILASLKPGEETGLIARVWECAGSATSAQVRLASVLAPEKATLTDHLERDQSTLPVENGVAQVPVNPRGVTSARIVSR